MRHRILGSIALLCAVLCAKPSSPQETAGRTAPVAIPPIESSRGGGSFRFAVLGDNQPHSPYAMPNKVYGVILDRINELGVDFTVNVGDVVAGYCSSATLRRQLADFMESSKKLKGPYHIAFGNHDMASPESATILKEMVGQPLYSSFTHKGALFILLNSNMPEQPLSVQGKQYAWLVEVLAQNADKKPIFVFLHIPVMLEDISKNEKLHRLFLRYGVAAVFSGHEHYYHVEKHDGIRYYITGGGGGPHFIENDQSFYHFLLVTVDAGSYRVDLHRVDDDASIIFTGGVEMESPLFMEPFDYRTHMENHDAAGEELETAAGNAPDVPLPRLEMANPCFERGEYDGVITECRAILAKNPKDWEALLVMGDALALKKQPRPAMDCYTRLLKYDPGNIRAHVHKGNLHLRMGDLDNAEKEYRQALSIKKDDVHALYNLALTRIRQSMKEWETDTYLHQQKSFRHIQDINSMLKKVLSQGIRGSLRARVLNNYAVVLYLGGLASAQAIEQYLDDAIVSDVQLPEPHVNLGNIQWETKRTGLAGLSYLTALKLDPACSAARYNLATLLVLEGQVDEGIGTYRELLARDPSFYRAWNTLAEVHLHGHKSNPAETRDLAMARDAWKKSLSINSSQPLVRKMLQKIAQEQSEILKATGPR